MAKQPGQAKGEAKQSRMANRAIGYTIPAPVGGLNTKDALAAMPETDAIVLDNMFCQPTWVEFREGHTTLAKFTGAGQRVLPYNGLSTSANRVFASVNNSGTYSIYRVDNASGGAVSTAVVGGANFTLSGVAITGTAGQFSCTTSSQPLVVNQTVTIAGTLGGTGSITGYVNPTTYLVSATNGSTTFTLTTLAGAALVTTAGTPTGLTYTVVNIQAITSGLYDYQQFGTQAAEVLVMVNGVDNPLLFDGSLWYSITATSSPYAWTGGPSPLTSLNQVAVYKNRLWFVQANSMNVYYLPQNVFAGAMTLLNLSANFKLGGYITAMVTVSIDNSQGSNDYIAFISNQGEVVMYQGYDPANVATWYIAAHFRIGAPIGIGRTCWQKMGQDALLLCQDGFVLMSEAMLTDRSQNKETVSDKIRYGVNTALQIYGNLTGWQAMLYPTGNKLILNVPTTANAATSYQYVMNTLSNAWSTWGLYNSPLNATHWETANNVLYYATAGSVEIADNGGYADNGNSISALVYTAFTYMGDRESLKRWTMCQPLFQTQGNLQYLSGLAVDFSQQGLVGTIPLSTLAGAPWNSSTWDVTLWGDSQQIQKKWVGLAGAGYCASLQLGFQYNGVAGRWQSTNYLYEKGGVFYGR